MSVAEKPDQIPGRDKGSLSDTGIGASKVTAGKATNCMDNEQLMEAVVERENMKAAYRRVVGNKGVAGADGMSVTELKPYLSTHWERIKLELLSDRYRPGAVEQVSIPKPNGGIRKLGIPSVVDRLIAQALYQVLKPKFEPMFSDRSYGFIQGRSAHQAVLQTREFVEEGYDWVVDIDLENFFDRVNHDMLMARMARKIKDKRILRLLRGYLQAGIMKDGVVTQRLEGTPQGSPLSPFLSNILLDDLDKELERRTHKFVRYADDCNIYVKSERAAHRVMESIRMYLSKRLRLKVNVEKSRVDRPWNIKFLGYSFTKSRSPRLTVAPQSLQRLKVSLQELARKGRGRALKRTIEDCNKKLRGWANYFKLAEVKRPFARFDGWIRRKLRKIIWRQLKTPRNRERALKQHGLFADKARRYSSNGRGPWWNAGQSHMNFCYPKAYFDANGLVSLVDIIVSYS